MKNINVLVGLLYSHSILSAIELFWLALLIDVTTAVYEYKHSN